MFINIILFILGSVFIILFKMPIQDENPLVAGEKVTAAKVSPTSKSTPDMSSVKSSEPEGATSIMLQSVSPINEAPQPSTSFSVSYRSTPGGPVSLSNI